MTDRDGHGDSDRDFPADRVPNEDRYFVLTEADFEDIAAELYAQLRELPEVTEQDACAAAEVVYDLGTGEWLYDDQDQRQDE